MMCVSVSVEYLAVLQQLDSTRMNVATCMCDLYVWFVDDDYVSALQNELQWGSTAQNTIFSL